MIKSIVFFICWLTTLAVVAMEHAHCSCGKMNCDKNGEEGHRFVVFTAWTSSTSLPLESGNYYLTEDVTISSRWSPSSSEIHLCLNGHSIMCQADARVISCGHYNGDIVSISIYDCEGGGSSGKITHAVGYEGIGVAVCETGRFSLYGGIICGNKGSSGGVKNYSTGIFTMYGGSITGNTASEYGGGVFNIGTFLMVGGSITDNTALWGGGGVWQGGSGAIMTISNKVKICGNTRNGSTENLCLYNSNIRIGAIESGSNIGVTGSRIISANAIEKSKRAEYKTYFSSDNPNYFIGYELPSGRMQFVDVSTHIHAWDSTWRGNANGHWHECSVLDCPIVDDALKSGYATHTPPMDDGDCTSAIQCSTCGYVFTAATTGHEYAYTGNEAEISESCSRANCTSHIAKAMLVAPIGSLIYDGTEKAAIVKYSADWCGATLKPSYGSAGNINAGTVTATIEKEGAVATITYEIEKASIGENGDEPGGDDLVKPDDGVSKFDVTVMYDGKGHTINTNALEAVTLSFGTPKFGYALAKDDAWSPVAPVFTNVCEASVWYKISADNYKDYIHEAKVTITNRPVTLTSGDGTWEFNGLAHSNITVTVSGEGFVGADEPTYSDFAEITEAEEKKNSFKYAFKDEVVVKNYLVTVVEGILIVTPKASVPELTAQLNWKFNAGSGTYFGQLKVTRNDEDFSKLESLKFIFADRLKDGRAFAQLWCTKLRAPVEETMTLVDGTEVRYVSLDPSELRTGATSVTYGVKDLAAKTVPANERALEIYVMTRVNPSADPDKFLFSLVWTLDGVERHLPIAMPASASNPKGFKSAQMPVTLAMANQAMAFNVAPHPQLTAEVEIASFEVKDGKITGTFRVKAGSDGRLGEVDAFGSNVDVVVMGAGNLGDAWVEVASATVKMTDKSFEIPLASGCKFFKVYVKVRNVIE